MKFTKLSITNFLAISEAQLRLDERGLVLIQGINEDDTSADSNGAGKSSIADALCWVLYGATARDVTGDDVINDKAGKGTIVTIEVEDGPDIYRIARHRKHKTGKNSLQIRKFNDATKMFDIDLTKGTDKLTQDVLLKIIGASHDVFKGAIYAGQEQMPDLPAMTDKHLKVLIEEAAGVTVLEAAYKEARTRLSTAQQAVQSVQVGLDGVTSKRDWINDQLVTVTAAKDAWDTDRKTKIAAWRSEATALVAQVKSLDVDIADIDAAAIDAQLANCDAKLASLGDEQKKRSELASAATKAEAQVSNLQNQLRHIKGRHENEKNELASVNAKIGAPCDECGRDHDASTMGAAKEACVKRANLIASEFKECKSELEDAQKRSGEAQGALEAFEATMTDASATTAQRASLQSQRSAYDRLVSERDATARKARDLGDLIKREASGANPHEQVLNSHNVELEKALDLIKDLTAKIQTLQSDVEIAESVVRVFSPAGVRAHILDEVTPFLNTQTAKYLATLSDGNLEATWATLVRNSKGELREKFSIEVTNDKGGKVFKAISGGEKRKVRVATALALQDLVATRATKPIELFIGDEIDDALDQAGLERLTQILEEKAKERGSVFIISHNSLRDWVSQIVTVRKKDGETTLVEETI